MRRKKIRVPLALVAYFVFVVIAYIFQAMVFTYLPIGGVVPLLLPIAVVGIAMFEGGPAGGGYGLFAGMLCDASFNQPVAVMTVALTVVGIAVGVLSETVIARGFPSFFVCCLGALLLASFISMFSLMFFEGVDFTALLSTAFLQTLYSLIFTLPFYFFLRLFRRKVSV